MGWESSVVLSAERHRLLCHCAVLRLLSSAGSCPSQKLSLCHGLQSCRSSVAFHCDPMWHLCCTDSGMYTVRVCMCVCVRVCVFVCMYVCLCACMCRHYVFGVSFFTYRVRMALGIGHMCTWLNINMHKQDVCVRVSIVCYNVCEFFRSRFITVTMWETSLSLKGKLSWLCPFFQERHPHYLFLNPWGRNLCRLEQSRPQWHSNPEDVIDHCSFKRKIQTLMPSVIGVSVQKIIKMSYLMKAQLCGCSTNSTGIFQGEIVIISSSMVFSLYDISPVQNNQASKSYCSLTQREDCMLLK